MAQALLSDLSIDPLTTSGDELAVILNRLHSALVSAHKGAGRPPELAAGGLWAKNGVGVDDIEWYLFDGTDDILAFSIVNNVFKVAGAAFSEYYKITDADTKFVDKTTANGSTGYFKKGGTDIISGTNITITTDGSGNITIASPSTLTSADVNTALSAYVKLTNGSQQTITSDVKIAGNLIVTGYIKANGDVTAYAGV